MVASIKEIDLPEAVFEDGYCFIDTVRERISGRVLGQAVALLGNDTAFFVRLLETTPGRLATLMGRAEADKLSRLDSEHVLDVLRLYVETLRVFEDREASLAWLASPHPLLDDSPLGYADTAEGRKRIRVLLSAMKRGGMA